MIFCALTGSPKEIFLIIFIILVSIFWIIYAHRFGKSIDEYFDTPNLDNLPDEITIEIVKEKPEAKPASSSTSQASSCSAPSSAPAPDDSSPRPTGKGGYLPE